MRNRLTISVLSLLTICAFLVPVHSSAQLMSDYTAYPPFVTNAVEPNILLVLDHSGSMQYPAYIGCEFNSYSTKRADCGSTDSIQNPEYSYDVTKELNATVKVRNNRVRTY